MYLTGAGVFSSDKKEALVFDSLQEAQKYCSERGYRDSNYRIINYNPAKKAPVKNYIIRMGGRYFVRWTKTGGYYYTYNLDSCVQRMTQRKAQDNIEKLKQRFPQQQFILVKEDAQ